MSARLDLIWNVTLQFLLVIVFGMPMIKGLHARCHIGRAGDYAWESTVSLHTCRSHCTTAETSHHWGKLHFHNICPMSIASGLLTACTVYLVGFCQNTEKSWRWKWDVGRIHLSSYLQNYSHPILVVVLRQTFVRWNIMKTGANVQCAYICLSVPRQSKRKTWSWQWLWLLKRNPTLLIMIPYVEKLLSVLWPGGKVQTCSEGQGQHGRMILLW